MSLQCPPNSSGTVINTFTVSSVDTQVVALYPGWGITHTPAAATQATITKSAGGSGVYHVATSISFMCAVVGTAQTLIQVNLRDGTTGAGTILWSISILKAASEAPTFFSAPVNIIGTANTAMTLEFSAAGVAASVQSVALVGYDRQ